MSEVLRLLKVGAKYSHLYAYPATTAMVERIARQEGKDEVLIPHVWAAQKHAWKVYWEWKNRRGGRD